jgi:hypothetical protein
MQSRHTPKPLEQIRSDEPQIAHLAGLPSIATSPFSVAVATLEINAKPSPLREEVFGERVKKIRNGGFDSKKKQIQ